MSHTQSELAQSIAAAAHKGQVDKAGKPYIMHPAHVAASVQGDAAKAVAWLHDVVEDTDYTVEDIENLFGPKIAQIVDGLTKISTTAIYPGFRASPKKTNVAQRSTQRLLPSLRGRGLRDGLMGEASDTSPHNAIPIGQFR